MNQPIVIFEEQPAYVELMGRRFGVYDCVEVHGREEYFVDDG